MHAAVNARHGGGKESCEHQSREPDRQLRDDKPRDDLIVFVGGHHHLWPRLVKKKQRRAETKKKKRRWYDKRRVGPYGARGRLFVGGGQEALDERLVTREGSQLDKESAYNDHPEHVGIQPSLQGKDMKLVLFNGCLNIIV
mgnify:CR=1 FL=1